LREVPPRGASSLATQELPRYHWIPTSPAGAAVRRPERLASATPVDSQDAVGGWRAGPRLVPYNFLPIRYRPSMVRARRPPVFRRMAPSTLRAHAGAARTDIITISSSPPTAMTAYSRSPSGSCFAHDYIHPPTPCKSMLTAARGAQKAAARSRHDSTRYIPGGAGYNPTRCLLPRPQRALNPFAGAIARADFPSSGNQNPRVFPAARAATAPRPPTASANSTPPVPFTHRDWSAVACPERKPCP